jgi:hypothetical protein
MVGFRRDWKTDLARLQPAERDIFPSIGLEESKVFIVISAAF